jgi:predicted urease superfamily metal-dependent hydrolase
MPENIRVIFFKDGDLWCAQCLEFDIGAQGPDLDTARRRFKLALSIERKTSIELHGEAYAGIGEAPAHFHEMWEKRSREFETESSMKEDGHSVEAQVALYA